MSRKCVSFDEARLPLEIFQKSKLQQSSSSLARLQILIARRSFEYLPDKSVNALLKKLK